MKLPTYALYTKTMYGGGGDGGVGNAEVGSDRGAMADGWWWDGASVWNDDIDHSH